MVVTELVDGTAIVVMDATGTGFHAAVGDLEHAAYAPSAASAGHHTSWSTSPSLSPITRPANAVHPAFFTAIYQHKRTPTS